MLWNTKMIKGICSNLCDAMFLLVLYLATWSLYTNSPNADIIKDFQCLRFVKRAALLEAKTLHRPPAMERML